MTERRNALMSEMKDFLKAEMGKIQESQHRIAETQINRIEGTLTL